MPGDLEVWTLQFLETEVIPRVLQAARLPAGTRLAGLRTLELEPPPYTGKNHCDSLGLDYFGNLMLPGLLLVLRQLAAREDIEPLHNCLCGLIWRDAEERVIARDLAFETSLPGIDNSEYEARYQAAEAAWQVWEQTDRELGAALQSFLLALSGNCF